MTNKELRAKTEILDTTENDYKYQNDNVIFIEGLFWNQITSLSKKAKIEG